MTVIYIEGKMLGRKRPLFEDWSIPWSAEPGGGGLTLRELIARVVDYEIAVSKIVIWETETSCAEYTSASDATSMTPMAEAWRQSLMDQE